MIVNYLKSMPLEVLWSYHWSLSFENRLLIVTLNDEFWNSATHSSGLRIRSGLENKSGRGKSPNDCQTTSHPDKLLKFFKRGPPELEA